LRLSSTERVLTVTFSWEINLGTLALLIFYAVGVVVFLVRTQNRANAAHEKAEEAKGAAAQAHKRADDAHLAAGAYNAALALFREDVAREYVDREALREMEQRLTNAINRLGDRVDQALHQKRS
jgi:cbb3-type cytochrome oxidase subunit 3